MVVAKTRPTLDLIPWDPESPDHVERLSQQRADCGWHADKPAGEWRDAQLAGHKCIFWLVLPLDDAQSETRIQAHVTKFPKQIAPLLDTCPSIRHVARTPSAKPFMPIGHIALDTDSSGLEHLELDMPAEGVMWIKTFYVSQVLQSAGLGRAAMDALESMATSPPISARTLMLDTVHKNDQLRPDFAMWFYGEIPTMANEEWYDRRGYRVIKLVPDFYRKEHPDAPGELRTVFMRKDLE